MSLDLQVYRPVIIARSKTSPITVTGLFNDLHNGCSKSDAPGQAVTSSSRRQEGDFYNLGRGFDIHRRRGRKHQWDDTHVCLWVVAGVWWMIGAEGGSCPPVKAVVSQRDAMRRLDETGSVPRCSFSPKPHSTADLSELWSKTSCCGPGKHIHCAQN